ncbi:MAG: metallophosphoesterase family protein [Candidatus Nezhaarchaeales archaeon]
MPPLIGFVLGSAWWALARGLCGKNCSSCPFHSLCSGCSASCLAHHCFKLGKEDCDRCPLRGCPAKPIDVDHANQLMSALKASTTFDSPFDPPLLTPLIPIGRGSRFIELLRSTSFEMIAVSFREVLEDEWLRAKSVEAGGVRSLLGLEVLVSTVMPDELLIDEVYDELLKFAGDSKPTAVLGWDSPCYRDDPKALSWMNALRSMVYTLKLAESLKPHGVHVVPLVKGGHFDQASFVVDLYRSLGFKTMCLHVTEYQTSRSLELLIAFIDLALRGCDKLILHGPSLPQMLRFLRRRLGSRFSRLRFVSSTWLSKAASLEAYTKSSTVDLTWLEAKCECAYCGGGRIPRSFERLSLHNLEVARRIVEGLRVSVEVHDVIAWDCKVMVIADLHVGSPWSWGLWQEALEFALKEPPRMLILLGDVFEPYNGKIPVKALRDFFSYLRRLRSRVLALWGDCDPNPEALLRMFTSLSTPRSIHKSESITAVSSGGLVDDVSSLLKLYGSARHVASILTAGNQVVTLVHGHNSPHTTRAYRRHRERRGILVLGHLHQSSHDPDRRIVTLGCWRRPTVYERRDGRRIDIGTLLIHEEDGALILYNPLSGESKRIS